MSDYPMTPVGKHLIENELSHLIRVEREQVKIEIAEARALGDLRENAEYAAAKEKQSLLEGRIAELQGKIARANVVEVKEYKGNKVVFGATVTLYDPEKDLTQTLQIVGEDEAKNMKGKVSYSSPLGKALIGHLVGDEVTVKAPKGDVIYEIQNISYT
jgi:transcription elongation factor GreA